MLKPMSMSINMTLFWMYRLVSLHCYLVADRDLDVSSDSQQRSGMISLVLFSVNQTSDTLQNLTLELATLGDLKLGEKPQPITMAPHDFTNIKANIKVASIENGIIFGNIVYDVTGSQSDPNVVVLKDMHIDIMD